MILYGRPPLPPYIRAEEANIERDRARYQTVYARITGSVAAPTAGLHFTDDLLEGLERQGTNTARILLHVGPATFTPVRVEDIRFHRMESESYEISEETGRQICEARRAHRRIIAVGTTCVRALEAAATPTGTVRPGAGKTNLFIRPGYPFKMVGGMITNFHLPRSTLLVLVCAFAGTELIRKAYQEAVRERYRFYSYGDACLIFD